MLEETKAFNPKIENFAVLLKDSRNDEGKLRMIGKVGIFQFPAEISWMLHPDFWGIGYASEAIKGYLEWYWQDEGQMLAPVDHIEIDLLQPQVMSTVLEHISTPTIQPPFV